MNNSFQESSDPLVPQVGKWLGVVLFLIVFAAGPFPGLPPEGQRLLAVTLLMACFWLTNAIPIYATSLIPLALFPALGILGSEEVSKAYIDHTVFLFFGGFVIALGIEKWGLHRRIALTVLTWMGGSPRRVVLGFMIATAFLSMWISNTATTLLMIPIALSLAVSLRESETENFTAAEAEKLEIALLLGIAYSASIGGLITLVGTPTNVAFQGLFESQIFSQRPPRLSMGKWIVTFLPMGLLFLGISWWLLCRKVAGSLRIEDEFFRGRLRSLGAMGRGEQWMLGVFSVTALLWMFRAGLDLGLGFRVPGWGDAAQTYLVKWLGASHEFAQNAINDTTVAMTMCILMFAIPVRERDSPRSQPLMDWKTLEKLPWGILLLFGGGFALAQGFQATGLSGWIGAGAGQLLSAQSIWVIVAGICLTMTFLTEFTTNVATVATMMPVLGALSVELGIDPRLIMIPAAVSASCAFMLPIATPPNAIVFASGKLKVSQMARYGFSLNLIGVVLITATMALWAIPQFEISTDGRPDWATIKPIHAELPAR
jgi:solute carrier family 13 (sodium-dependent dicarboxylate transporter), member 2/3/5